MTKFKTKSEQFEFEVMPKTNTVSICTTAEDYCYEEFDKKQLQVLIDKLTKLKEKLK